MLIDASQLAEDLLSDEQHAEYDAAVNHEVQRDKRLAQTPPTSIVFPYLLATIARFSGGVIDASYQAYDEICSLYDSFSLTEKLALAWKSGSYREIRNLAQLRVPLERSPHMMTITIRFAWIGEYYGDFHKVMLTNINSMERGPGRPSFANVVQSSGSGKSRTVDEIGNLIFTIPFNIRHGSDFSPEAYPLDDDDVLPYFRAFSKISRVERRFVLFFHRLFSEVADEVKRVFCTENKLSAEELARQWKAHLSWINNRSRLYARVVKGSDYDEVAFDDDQIVCPRTTLDALLAVLNSVCDLPISNDIKVLLYFDDAHRLDDTIGFREQKRTLYDIAWSALDRFTGYDVFTLFLSTRLPQIMAARYTKILPPMDARQFQAPITETPFDCHPCFPLRPSQLRIEDLGELPFLARFGRPLFWTMIEAPNGHFEGIDEVIKLACSRITSDIDINLTRKLPHSDIAMLAVLDILVSIDYDPRKLSPKTQLDMVASHMRTVFSVTVHGFNVHSGYPSEPFLAEAASRQMYRYLAKATQYGNRILYGSIVDLLRKTPDRWVSRGGRMVMRILLRKAYLDAIVAEQPCEDPNFSKGCSFLQFLKALFADNFHPLILKSQPDNYEVESRCSALEDAFEHAVVRFTHFVRAADDSAVKTRFMISAFVRGSALIIRENKLALDVVIPILLDRRSELTESSMSALFIRVKRREHLGGTEAYTIDAKTFGFFPEKQDSRPYVTLVAELGADVPSFTGQAPNTVHNNDTRSASTLDADHPRYSIRAYGCTTAAWKVVGDHPSVYVGLLGEEGLSGGHARESGPNAETLAVVRPSAAVEVGPYRYASVPADEVPELEKEKPPHSSHEDAASTSRQE